MDTILAVEDEKNIADLIELYLSKEGFAVEKAATGEEGLAKAKTLKPALIILDIMLPGIDGWEVCREIRKESDVPIIMLTAKESETDKVVGLELGADDYMTKPFSPRELAARVKAVLRRAKTPAGGPDATVIRADDLTIDLGRRQVKLDEKEVSLTAKEFELLSSLASRPGIVFTREQLLENIWGYDFYGGTRTVDVHVRHLREKLGDNPDKPRFIETVRGTGYRFKGE